MTISRGSLLVAIVLVLGIVLMATAAPGTRKLAARYKGKAFQIVPVHVGEDSPTGVRRWASSNKYTGLPVLLDTGSTRRAYGISVVPTQVLVDKSGKVLQLYRGWMPNVEEALGQDTAAVLSGKPLPKHSFPLVGYG